MFLLSRHPGKDPVKYGHGRRTVYRRSVLRSSGILLVLLLTVLRLIFLPGLALGGPDCALPVQAGSLQIREISDLDQLRIGVVAGTTHDTYVTEHFPNATILRYSVPTDLVLALKGQKIDAAVMTMTTARLIMAQHPTLAILNKPLRDAIPKGVGFNKNDTTLPASFNQFLKEIRANGVYDEIVRRWIDTRETLPAMPEIDQVTSGPKLIVGTVLADLPFIARINGQYVGFDAEMMQRFGLWLNRPVEMVDFEFSALIMALVTGKVDVIVNGLNITEERARQINFSDPYLPGFPTVIMALRSNLAAVADDSGSSSGSQVPDTGTASFWQRLQASFTNNLLVEQRYRLILRGLRLTALISVLAAIFGTLLGALVCWLRMSRNWPGRILAGTYITIMRGLPVLVLLLIIFYVIFAKVNISAVLVAVIAFGLNFAAYVAEIFRSAIRSVDRGQAEAGIASGFSKLQTFYFIVLPQAIRQALPVYKGELISLVKMTSVVGYVAVEDLTKASDMIRSRTFDAFFPLIIVALLYFTLAFLITTGLDYLSQLFSRRRSRPPV